MRNLLALVDHGRGPGTPRTDEWLTPPSIIEALGGPGSFDLDPASPAGRPWPTALMHFTKDDDGLSRDWFGRVWLNPPYSRPLLGRFMDRMAGHGRGTALIFARTDTEVFHRHVWERAGGLLFLKGRMKFHSVSGEQAGKDAGAPVVLCAYGADDVDRLAQSGIDGKFVPLVLVTSIAGADLGDTWSSIVQSVMRRFRGAAVRLEEIYAEVGKHARARASHHFKDKVRQVLQEGPFEPVGRGVWRMPT